MYNMVAIVDDTVLYNLNFAKRVERRHFLKHTEKVNKWGVGCVNSVEKILSQCMHVPNHHNVYFKYLKILFVNYTSVRLKKEEVMRVRFQSRII